MPPEGAIGSLEELKQLFERGQTEPVTLYLPHPHFQFEIKKRLLTPQSEWAFDRLWYWALPENDRKNVEFTAIFNREGHPHQFVFFTNYFHAWAFALKKKAF